MRLWEAVFYLEICWIFLKNPTNFRYYLDMMQMRDRSLNVLALRFLSEPPAVDLQVGAAEEEAEVGG